ncbi:hypothetical protein ACMFMG_008904 [Clarireedia jacksonii]
MGRPSTEEEDLYLEAFSTYQRKGEWAHLPEETKSRHAIHLGFRMSPGDFFKNNLDPSLSSSLFINGPAIALETRFVPSDRNLSNFSFIEDTLDLSLLRQALDDCLQTHGGYCSGQQASELSSTRMIDVVDRTVVSYPQGCDYFALSYVWGGKSPSPGALENKCLPRTIEDAIKVTKALGRRYLWVDALCIDQSPNLTESQMKEKQKQLDMMATIYDCATVTLVAETENIGGCVLFTVPQEYKLEAKESTWSHRAWTMQEELLSRRLLRFHQSQVLFDCVIGHLEEGMDTTTFFKDGPSQLPPGTILPYTLHVSDYNSDSHETSHPEEFKNRLRYFTNFLDEYTAREMTFDSDSLNAFRGVLRALERKLFPEGFVHGLPLRSHPASLAWMHFNSATARRRVEFPSWCWTGWEGQVCYRDQVLDNSDAHDTSTLAIDFEVRFVSCHGNELEVEGWVVDLDIRTEPLSELFIPGQEDSIASVKEGKSTQNNTLKTGRYKCLIVQRICQKIQGRKSPKETIYLLALDQTGRNSRRQAILTVMPWSGCSFDQVQHRKEVVRLV